MENLPPYHLPPLWLERENPTMVAAVVVVSQKEEEVEEEVVGQIKLSTRPIQIMVQAEETKGNFRFSGQPFPSSLFSFPSLFLLFTFLVFLFFILFFPFQAFRLLFCLFIFFFVVRYWFLNKTINTFRLLFCSIFFYRETFSVDTLYPELLSFFRCDYASL